MDRHHQSDHGCTHERQYFWYDYQHFPKHESKITKVLGANRYGEYKYEKHEIARGDPD
jgi:hypothetical protein